MVGCLGYGRNAFESSIEATTAHRGLKVFATYYMGLLRIQAHIY
jgi:hypothetical protein